MIGPGFSPMHFSEKDPTVRPSERPTAREIVLKMCKQQRLLRVLANGVGDSERPRRRRRQRRRRRHGKIGENAPWLQNIIITAAAAARRASRLAHDGGQAGGRAEREWSACFLAATEVVRKTQRNDEGAWHRAEREREREIMRLWTLLASRSAPPRRKTAAAAKKEKVSLSRRTRAPTASSLLLLLPSSLRSLRPSVRPSLVPRRRRHRKRRRSRLICPNGLCLRQREQDHKNSETARGRERASGSHSQT